jgi:hypothetical protein
MLGRNLTIVLLEGNKNRKHTKLDKLGLGFGANGNRIVNISRVMSQSLKKAMMNEHQGPGWESEQEKKNAESYVSTVFQITAEGGESR